MQTIIVALDGSPQAEQILPYVRLLAPALQANVLLVQVLAHANRPPISAAAPANQRSNGAGISERTYSHTQPMLGAQCHAERYLETQAAPLRASGISVACSVETGSPAAAIIAVAERHQAAFIALASHGYSGLRRWANGSVAEQIIKSTDVPVLLARIAKEPSATPASLRRVLVPLDGTAYTRYALEHGIAVAQGAQSELIILETVAPSIEDYLGGTVSLLEKRDAMRENVRGVYAARWGKQRAAQAMISTAIGLGSPADAIVEEAHQRNVGLIVLALPARSPLHRRAGGSVAELVFHSTHTPLLLVHAPVRFN